jgi:AcrR family transcriptional regulator
MNQMVKPKRLRRTETPDKRILKHALHEFSAYGYAGARMERIAQKAKLSKRMLFYYFKSKEHLFEVVLAEALQLGRVSEPSSDDALATSPFWSAFHMDNPQWARLLAWEGLAGQKSNLPRLKKRRAANKARLKSLEASFGTRVWAENLDPFYVMYALIAVQFAPVLLPNLAYVMLGEDVNSPNFRRKWVALVSALGAAVTKKKAAA